MPQVKAINEIIKEVVPYYKGKGEPEATFNLFYDSASETLEPIYFWLLDLMKDVGLSTEKLVDNFTSSPGSGHFGEFMQRATIMQQQASQTLANINTVLRSVLNIIYDLKDFKIRMQSYEDLKSENKDKKEAALLSLKQIWMDKVDIQKGNSSIKAMALGQAGFQTLLDAFLVAKNEADADKIDLNERVKRIVKARIEEFNIWLSESEKELNKRYELERSYLRSQVNSMKLYSRWAKPYLKAASELEQKEHSRNADLVKTFSTALLELTLFGKAEVSPPPELGKISNRKYYKCVLVDFQFRALPQKVSQRGDYTFGGRADVTFRAYALNEDELKKLDEALEKSDVADVLSLVEGATDESLSKMQEEIDYFLKEEENEKEKKQKSPDTSNPFLAMLGIYNKSPEKKETKKTQKKELIKPDTWQEKTHIRPKAAAEAKQQAFDLFDVYKKAHQMASYT